MDDIPNDIRFPLDVPLLQAIGDGQDDSNAEIVTILAQRLGVTERRTSRNAAERAEGFCQSGGMGKNLFQEGGPCGFPSTGNSRSLTKGKPFCSASREDQHFFFASFLVMRASEADEEEVVGEGTRHTPEELMASSYLEINNALADALLEQIHGTAHHLFSRGLSWTCW